MLAPTDEARVLPDNLRDRLESAFERGAGHGLLELGIREVGTALPADFAYWRDFAGRYVTMLCTSAQPDGGTSPAALSIIAAPPAETLAALANELSQVVADLAEFLMPAAKAVSTSAEYPVRWEPLGPWQYG